MIDSETDPMSLSGPAQADRVELESGLQRNGMPATVTANTDFVAILRRRLFAKEPTVSSTRGVFELIDATIAGAWKNDVFSHLYKNGRASFGAEVDRCYPFHPDLVRLVEEEWSVLAGYQKVRSTIRIFAATANAQAARADRNQWAPIRNWTRRSSAVRQRCSGSDYRLWPNFDPKNQSNYRGIAENDVVDQSDENGSARELDIAKPRRAPPSSLRPTLGPPNVQRPPCFSTPSSEHEPEVASAPPRTSSRLQCLSPTFRLLTLMPKGFSKNFATRTMA